MTDETKQLFNAPWTGGERRDKLSDDFVVIDDKCATITSHIITKETANRLARLPELYDALAEAIRDACEDCVTEAELRTGMIFDPVEYGCVYPERDCCPKCRGWIELLRKVRDGE